MRKLKIGLLPLFLKLYVDTNPKMLERSEDFYRQIVQEFYRKGIDVVEHPISCVEEEFGRAVDTFTSENVDAIVTLHLAYSPSLESAGPLSKSDLPIIILNTTETYDFGQSQDKKEISYNHGIHGVQDMCNLLIRNKKEFIIEAGHWKNSDVIDRVISAVKAARIARSMKNAKIGQLGNVFKGMGDFQVSKDVLTEEIGVDSIQYSFDALEPYVKKVTEAEIETELELDHSKFLIDGIDKETYKASVKAGLALRKWIDAEKLTGFTMNFNEFTASSGMPTVPFLEASKSMARGVGYAGEGDVLTASLVSAILSVFSDTTFTEMFCPDWKNDTIFLSHMGEMNTNLSDDKPVAQVMNFNYTDIEEKPVAVSGKLKSGQAVLVNLAPGPNNKFTLIIAAVDVIDSGEQDNMDGKIRGWIKSKKTVSDFLEKYSIYGGTHHSALVYNCSLRVLMQFGNLMGWYVVEI